MIKNGTLFPAPYVRGQLGFSSTAHRVFHIVLSFLFVVTPVAFMVTTYIQSVAQIAFSIIWLVLAVLVLWVESYGRTTTQFLAMDVLLLISTISGFPGMINQLGGGLAIYTLAFGFFLLVRNICLFIIIPRSRMLQKIEFEKVTMTWMFVGCLITLLASTAYMTSQGFTISGSGRFFSERWLHPNNISIYSGLILMLHVLAKHIPWWLRWPGSLLGVYCLLVNETRGVIAAIILTMMVLYVLNTTKHFFRNLVIGVIGVMVLAAFLPYAWPKLMEVERISSMFERTFEAEDPTSGRIAILSAAMEEWRKAFLFGYGYKGQQSVDNAIIAYGLEAGLVGLLVYFAFVFGVLGKAIAEFYTNKNARIQNLAKITIVFTTFILFRSLVERSHSFQLSDLVSNGWLLFAGYLFAQTQQVRIGSTRPRQEMAWTRVLRAQSQQQSTAPATPDK